MANTVISLKKSATPSATPSALANGELAINYADGKLFYKAANGTIVEFATGIDSSDFGTVNVGGTLLVSDVQGDILTITAGDNIVLTPDAGGDSFSIGADLSGATDYANSTFLANTTGTFDGDLTVTGNVGIGTTSPGSPLVIDQGNRTNIPSLRLINLGAGSTGIDIGPLSIGDNSGNEIQYDVPNKRLAYRVRGNLGGGPYPAHDFTIDSTASPSFDSVMRIYSPASGADLLNIVAGSSEIFTVQYDGNVGIGTTSPNYKLDVIGTANITSNLTVQGTDVLQQIGIVHDDTNTSTTIASAAFDQANSTTFTSNVVVSVSDNTNAALRITQTGTGEAIRVEDSANPDATSFVVDANGDVKIGTTVTAKFAFSDFVAGKTFLYGASPGSNWYFDYLGSGTSYLGSNTFIIRNAKSTTEYMRITSAGRLAIGRTTADYEIDVNGSVNASALLVNGSPISGGGGAYFSGNNGDTGDVSGLGDIFRVHSNTLSQNVTIYSGNNALAAGPITVDSGKSITIQTGARMVIA